MLKLTRLPLIILATLILPFASAWAQEKLPAPYFIAYDHNMGEVGTLEIETDAVQGQASNIPTFIGDATQFEYGVTRWWTAEFYIDWQHTNHEGNLFPGYRIESRFRPMLEPHKINPVFYFEYEHLNEADKALKEIVGFDNKADLAVPNSVARHEQRNELEGRLILSSDIGNWNLTENLIVEKNLNSDPFEFGYAIGLSRPFVASSGKGCVFCAESFAAGLEMYGGLGTTDRLNLNGTSHYVGPVFGWAVTSSTALRFSPGWGITGDSARMLIRFGVSQEVDGFGHMVGKLFHR